MKVTINKQNEKTLVTLEGRIDTTTAPEFSEYLKRELPGVKHLVLDLQGVDYVSSAGLRAILFAQKTMNAQGDMKVARVNSDIMETFELTGFTDILEII
jgi:anti-sigma B factor antagonist